MTAEKKPPNKTHQHDTEKPDSFGSDAQKGDTNEAHHNRGVVPTSDDTLSEPRSIVKQFFRKGEAFIEELLNENEKLRMHVMHMESKLRREETEIPTTQDTGELQEIIEKLRQEHEDLRKRYDEILAETHRHKTRYETIEEENEKLANLFVASYQLHSTMDLDEAVQIVTEILLNFVGAGRFALLMREGEMLEPVASYGITIERISPVSIKEEWVKRMVTPGKPYVASEKLRPNKVNESEPMACLPLSIDGMITGALVIYSFLQQKVSVSPIDMELFNLLSEHTAVVLEGARLFKESSKEPAGANKYRALLDSEY